MWQQRCSGRDSSGEARPAAAACDTASSMQGAAQRRPHGHQERTVKDMGGIAGSIVNTRRNVCRTAGVIQDDRMQARTVQELGGGCALALRLRNRPRCYQLNSAPITMPIVTAHASTQSIVPSATPDYTIKHGRVDTCRLKITQIPNDTLRPQPLTELTTLEATHARQRRWRPTSK